MRNRKPCPGCKRVVRYRPADGVCEECAHAIAEWSKHVEASHRDKTLATVKFVGAPHWYPQFYFGGNCHRVEGLNETRKELSKLFFDLPRAVAVEVFDWKDRPSGDDDKISFMYEKPRVLLPKKGKEQYQDRADYPTSDGHSCYRDEYAKIDTRVLSIIRALWDRTARFAEMAYLGGLQDGRDLLAQLSNGELSATDLEERDMRIAKHVQNAAYLHKKLGAKG